MWITIIVLLLLAAWAFFAVRRIRSGGARCSGDCSACGQNCPKREQDPS